MAGFEAQESLGIADRAIVDSQKGCLSPTRANHLEITVSPNLRAFCAFA